MPKKTTKPKRLTKAQRHAAAFLEYAGIVHYLLTQQKCPVIFEGKLAFVRCPGVSKAAFKKAIDDLVVRNLCAMVSEHRAGKVINHAGPA